MRPLLPGPDPGCHDNVHIQTLDPRAPECGTAGTARDDDRSRTGLQAIRCQRIHRSAGRQQCGVFVAELDQIGHRKPAHDARAVGCHIGNQARPHVGIEHNHTAPGVGGHQPGDARGSWFLQERDRAEMQEAAFRRQLRQRLGCPGRIGAATRIEGIAVGLRCTLNEGQGGRCVAAQDETGVHAVAFEKTHQAFTEQVGRQLREEASGLSEARAGDGRVERRTAFVAQERQRACLAGSEIDQGFARECNAHDGLSVNARRRRRPNQLITLPPSTFRVCAVM